MNKNTERIQALEDAMRLLKSMGGGGGSSSNIVDALKDMEDRIKEFTSDKFATKADLDDMMGARVNTGKKSEKEEPASMWPDPNLSKVMKETEVQHARILRNEKNMDELKRMLSKHMNSTPPPTHEAPSPLLKSMPTSGAGTLEDLENSAGGAVGDTLNKILTYLRKLEIRIDEKSEKMEC